MTFVHPSEPGDDEPNVPALLIPRASTVAPPANKTLSGGLSPNLFRREGFTSPPPAGVILNDQAFINTPFADLPFYFPTLTNPVIGYDGGFNAAALAVNQFGVICIMPAYLGMEEFDFISLVVNGVQVAIHTVTEDEALNGKPIVLFINSIRFIDQANNTIQAFLTQIGGATDQTKLFNMLVDRVLPVSPGLVFGKPYNDEMAPLKFTDPLIEGFGVITQQQANNGVEVEIADYPLNRALPQGHWRKEGDIITVSIGGILVSHTVTSFEASGTAPIRFTIYFGTWSQLLDGVYIMEWFVRDKVGNQSPGFSPPRLIQLDRGTSTEPLLPAVFASDSDYDPVRDVDFIDTRLLTSDTPLELSIRNFGYALGDTVVLLIRGLSADGTATETTINYPITSITPIRVYIDLDLDFLLPLAGGRILITYRRVRAGVPDRPSQGALYAIDGEPVEDGLAAPQVLDLDDGALPTDTNPVRVLVPRYLGQNPNDRIDLIVTGRTANGTPRYATYTDMAGSGDILFELENAFFAELEGGYFVAFYEVNGAAVRPPSKSVTVPVGDANAVLPAPWTLQAGPPDFTFDPGVSLANLNVRVDPNPAIVEGVEVRLIAIGTGPNGSFFSPWFLVDLNWEGSVLPFTVPRVNVLANLNGTMRLYYEVKPATPGAATLQSRDLVISVGMALKLTTPPRVLEATAISPTEAELNPLHVQPPSPIVVTIRVEYTGMLASDDVTVHIVGMPGLGEPVIPSKPGVPDAGENYITFTVLSGFVAAYIDSFCEVFFTVTRNGNTVESTRLTMRVTALPSASLDLVSVPEASSGNVISVNATNHVQIDRWPFFKAGQAVFIELVHTSGDLELRDGWVVTAEEFAAGRTQNLIPSSYLTPKPDASTLTINAKVSLNGTNLETEAIALNSRTYTLRAVPPLTIPSDTRTVNLGGWLLGAGFGNNERAYLGSTRTASGGKPPYVYSSSSGAVTVNSSTGQVNINYTGDATITVRDQSQPAQTASYRVQVTGSYQTLRYVGSAPWWNANATGQLLSMSQLSSLISRFGSALPVIQVWTIHKQSDTAHYSVYLPSGHGLDYSTWSGDAGSLGVFVI